MMTMQIDISYFLHWVWIKYMQNSTDKVSQKCILLKEIWY